MCGFVVAIPRVGGPLGADTLRAMTSLVQHRGPDDEGYFENGWIGIGFRRLAILDLSHQGHQPMLDESGRYLIVHNGEVYNYQELRTELQRHGFAFRSNTDTEVILKAYLHWGPGCVNRFIGMFAFVIVDLETRTVTAFRDPFGIKPLYYLDTSEVLAFVSEVKSLAALVRLSPNQDAFYEYLVFRYVLGRHTLFKDVYALLPGTYVTSHAGGTIRETVYFDLPTLMSQPEEPVPDIAVVIKEVDELIRESVRLHLRSDVPLGATLSGGIDSSLVTALAAQQNADNGLDTFSIAFQDPLYDESRYQQLVAQRYRTRHHVYELTPERFTDLLEQVIWHLDFPLNHANTIALYYLSVRARAHVTVLLSGEGADELFRGYGRYARLTRFHMLRRLSRFSFGSALPKRGSLRAFGQLLKYHPAIYATSFASPVRVAELCPELLRDVAYREVLSRQVNGRDRQVALLDCWGFLQSLLERQDKVSMAVGLEARVPFCNPILLKQLLPLPRHLHVRQRNVKYLLKRIAERYLPYEVIYRGKRGFGLPLSQWWKDPKGFGRYIEVLTERRTLERGIFSPKVLRGVIEEHLAGACDHGPGILWTTLNLELWHRLFIDRSNTFSLPVFRTPVPVTVRE